MNSSTGKQLQGPRPSRLEVSRDSSKIIKKKSHPNQVRPPVIVYLKSPDIIEVRPEDFMGLVQRLTGKQSDTSVNVSSTSATSLPAASNGAMAARGDDNDVAIRGVASSDVQNKFDSEIDAAYPSFYGNIYADHCDWQEFEEERGF